MTDTEILHALNGIVQDPYIWNKKQQNDAIDRAVDALEKQIPKKVSKVDMRNVCPNEDCKEYILRHYAYCCECGQKLDWEE